jgi:hypothetical protein
VKILLVSLFFWSRKEHDDKRQSGRTSEDERGDWGGGGYMGAETRMPKMG